MKKVKIISTLMAEWLEKEINKWLQQHGEANVINISYCIEHGSAFPYQALILYEEIEPKEVKE